jgi:hypothetical protein
MGIFNTFFRRIKALLDKKDIEYTISNQEDIITDLKGLCDQYALFLAENKITSADLKYIVDNFYKNYDNKVTNRRNLFEDISNGLSQLEKNLEVVNNYIDKNLSSNTVGTSLSLKKGFCVAFVDNTEFCLDYIQLVLDYYVSKEVVNSTPLSKADVAKIENNIKRFSMVFSDLSKPNDKFKKDFDKIADIIITNDNEEIAIHEDKSGFNLNTFMGFKYSPIFYLRRLISDYSVNVYKARKEKIKYLQLRLMYLEAENRDTPDPRIEKEMELVRNRIEKLESANHEVERDIGLEES